MWELVRGVGHQGDEVEELFQGRRDGEEVLEEGGLFLIWGLRGVFCGRILCEFGRHEGEREWLSVLVF